MYSFDLSKEEIGELQDIYIFVKSFFWEKEYFSFTRESMANRSVEHLHIHFLVGKLQWKYLRKMLEKQGFPISQELIL
jgi:diadenosine tetraphosphate (Ap4A) HIT family hydrolase